MLRRSALLVLLLAAPAALAQYGATEFPNSGAAEAQDAFLRGLLMLHSFEYEDAREAFQEARRIDTDFAMAAWGEAMTHNHPIWQEQDRDAAIAALGDLWEDIGLGLDIPNTTEREEDYLMTLRALYGEGTKEERDFAYADAMADLSATYPDDLDAASFYALSILGTAHEGRDFAIYMDAAAVAEEVFDINPEHPGATHYLIHTYDDPIHAPLGLRPARVYADIAPSASHALHMPSHIYFALGMWDEGAEMNERSYQAAKARTDARGEPLNGHGWHALVWLHYAELQRGRYDEARQLLDRVAAHIDEDESRAYYLPYLRAMVAAETEDWDLVPLGDEPTERVGDGRIFYVHTRAALDAGDRATAEALVANLQARLEADESPSEAALVTALELEALLALDAGDADAALALLDEAAAVEDEMPLDFGPASPVKPAHELLGEVLLQLDQPDEAWLHFDETLARYPRRARALLGYARAAERAGDLETARATYAILADIWHDADTDLPALTEVQEHATVGMR
jgi:tetratricopeptide (TPR) repeat protein